MSALSRNTKHRLNVIIKRFKFEELQTLVMPCFPEISWNQVKRNLMSNHDNFTVTDALPFIMKAIHDAKLEERDLSNRLSILEITEVSRHSNRKTWYANESVDNNNPPSFLSNRDIKNRIRQYSLAHNVPVKVHLITYNDVTYISIKYKNSVLTQKKKTQTQSDSQIFFALLQGQKYFFCTKRKVPQIFINAVISSMGYKKSKEVKLMGKDLKSLIKMLMDPRCRILPNENWIDPSVFTDSAPVVKRTGIDFTQHKQRASHTDKCFGEDPPTLELLTVEREKQPWCCELLKVKDKTVQTRWEFRSNDIIAFLKKLSEHCVLEQPLPPYIADIMIQRSNELTLKNK